MIFKIDNNFLVITSRTTEKLKETIIVPQTIQNGKPFDYKNIPKTREFTTFTKLRLLHEGRQKFYAVITNIFNFIDLIEILKAYSSKKLDTENTYKPNDSFSAKVSQKNGKPSLEIRFKAWDYSQFFDRIECNILAAKFSKILQRCEPWQEQDQ